MTKEELLKAAFESIVDCDESKAMGILKEAEEMGIDPVELLSTGYSAGIKHLGDLFGRGEVFLPELIFSTEVMKTVTAEIESKMEASRIYQADIVGSSALLTTTMTEQKKIEDLMVKSGLKEKVKTMVGGAPVTKRWAEKIGADYYCEDATDTVKFALEVLSAKA